MTDTNATRRTAELLRNGNTTPIAELIEILAESRDWKRILEDQISDRGSEGK